MVRVARYVYEDRECYGILEQQSLFCLPDLAEQFKLKLPERLEDFVVLGEQAVKTAEELLKEIDSEYAESLSVPIDEVSFLAPITAPPKIICLGLNYLDHAAETDAAVPKEPIIFMKPRTAIIGPNEHIIKPSFVKQLDYEGELAIIIGKKAKNVTVSEAKNYVFGYTVFNDISAREIQFGDGQWTRGKSFDTFAPTGPYIVTENQLKDTNNLRIRTWVNEELRQNGTTKNMVFNVSEIVHQLSRVMTLEPCDIIATGTPAGVGMAMKPRKFLKHGDVVRIEIEGIGTLENIVEESYPTFK
jgi:2-keto-4-pentenoate hydratase/2-oxohepta-3-ene-1,7-dioic acid hydratase in catechol pathway